MNRNWYLGLLKKLESYILFENQITESHKKPYLDAIIEFNNTEGATTSDFSPIDYQKDTLTKFIEQYKKIAKEYELYLLGRSANIVSNKKTRLNIFKELSIYSKAKQLEKITLDKLLPASSNAPAYVLRPSEQPVSIDASLITN